MSDTMKIEPEEVYAIGAAARLLRLSPSSLRDLERRGKIACARTPGGQRRFLGADLLRLLERSPAASPKEPTQRPSVGTLDTGDATARHAWLGQCIARAQRALPADTPAEIRLRLGADLEHALGTWGPASPVGDVEPLITSLVERAKLQVQAVQEGTERRAMKAELLNFGLTHLRRRIDTLPRRLVGVPGSLTRRHIRATLRDQLRDQLQKRLRGDEDWGEVREAAEELVAAWFVAQAPVSRMSKTVTLFAVGATGLVGGAAAAAALSPEIRAQAAKLKAPLLSLADDLLTRLSASPPTESSPPTPPNQPTTTPPPFRPSAGFGVGWPASYRRNARYSRRVTPTSPEAPPEPAASSDGQARDAAPMRRDGGPPESPGAPSPPS